MGTFVVPRDWKAGSNVEWTYANVSYPVRASMRAEAPDGSAWVESFPSELFYWLEPVAAPTPIGNYNLGMIHKPNISISDTMQRFVIPRYRGRQQKLQIVGIRPVPNLPQSLGQPPQPGEAIAVRIKYVVGGATVDEEIYGHLGRVNRIPYHGPQGTWYENQRLLLFVHSMGAKNGMLESMYPVLGYIASSFRIDPEWEKHATWVYQQLAAEFQRQIARGYDQIAAAGATSRAISANNDSMLAGMAAQRQAAQQRDAQRRTADQRSPNEGFSEYIRGTQRMKDPYWGESEQSSYSSYHWTDGSGSYRSSNDSTYNPNIGAGGGPTWQRMEPVGR